MNSPTSTDVHVNRPLTNISVATFQNNANFIAPQIAPTIGVDKQTDLFVTYDRGAFNRDEMKKRADITESAGGGYTIGQDSYRCDVYAFHHDIGDQRRANADSTFRLDAEATRFVTLKALLKREKLVISTLFQGGVWTHDWDGVASSPGSSEVLQWDNANSTPIEDVRAAKTAMLENTGIEPNTMVIGHRVLDALMDHPDIVDRVKYGTQSQVSLVDLPELRQLFRIDRVFVSKAIENTAVEGAADNHGFMFGNKAWLGYVSPTPGLMTPSAAYGFAWTGMLGAGAAGQRIKRFRMEMLAADRIEIEMAYQPKVIAPDLGYFFDTVVG